MEMGQWALRSPTMSSRRSVSVGRVRFDSWYSSSSSVRPRKSSLRSGTPRETEALRPTPAGVSPLPHEFDGRREHPPRRDTWKLCGRSAASSSLSRPFVMAVESRDPDQFYTDISDDSSCIRRGKRSFLPASRNVSSPIRRIYRIGQTCGAAMDHSVGRCSLHLALRIDGWRSRQGVPDQIVRSPEVPG